MTVSNTAHMRHETGGHTCLRPADLLGLPYVEEFEGVTTLDTILMDWGMNEGRREDFARWLIEEISQPHRIQKEGGK